MNMTEPNEDREDASGEISSPWDVQAQKKLDEGMSSLNAAREWVIVDWLTKGDPRPYVDWIRRGYEPLLGVQRILAEMMDPRSGTATIFPFCFVKKRRDGKPGRAVDPAVLERNALIADYVKAKMDENIPYESAIMMVVELVGSDNGAIEEKTVRNAYDLKYGKKRGAANH